MMNEILIKKKKKKIPCSCPFKQMCVPFIFSQIARLEVTEPADWALNINNCIHHIVHRWPCRLRCHRRWLHAIIILLVVVIVVIITIIVVVEVVIVIVVDIMIVAVESLSSSHRYHHSCRRIVIVGVTTTTTTAATATVVINIVIIIIIISVSQPSVYHYNLGLLPFFF